MGSDCVVKSDLIVGSVEAGNGGLSECKQFSSGAVEVALSILNDVSNSGVVDSLAPKVIKCEVGVSRDVVVASLEFSGGCDVEVEE